MSSIQVDEGQQFNKGVDIVCVCIVEVLGKNVRYTFCGVGKVCVCFVEVLRENTALHTFLTDFRKNVPFQIRIFLI